jgi:hypothetical protein
MGAPSPVTWKGLARADCLPIGKTATNAFERRSRTAGRAPSRRSVRGRRGLRASYFFRRSTRSRRGLAATWTAVGLPKVTQPSALSFCWARPSCFPRRPSPPFVRGRRASAKRSLSRHASRAPSRPPSRAAPDRFSDWASRCGVSMNDWRRPRRTGRAMPCSSSPPVVGGALRVVADSVPPDHPLVMPGETLGWVHVEPELP